MRLLGSSPLRGSQRRGAFCRGGDEVPVDARLSKKFNASGADIEISASVFNALGSQFEAEEQVVWLPDYRRINMVQPPRAFVIGVRIER